MTAGRMCQDGNRILLASWLKEKSGGTGIDALSNTQPVKARLYILQHGAAVPKDQDPDRPLSAQGQSDIQRLAGRLVEHSAGGGSSGDLNIGSILHSDKLRAEQTAQIIADSLESSVHFEACSGISPNDNAAVFMEDQNLMQRLSQGVVQKMGGGPGTGNMMIVSHMPFVSNLCSTLLTGTTEVEFDFKPGTLVCLFYEYEEWSMEYMIRPEFY